MTVTHEVPAASKRLVNAKRPRVLRPDHGMTGSIWAGSWGALALIPLCAGFALYSGLSEEHLWAFERMRAADRAGLYLFFTTPMTAGLACWEVFRWRRDTSGLEGSLPEPGLLWRTAWIRVAAVALAGHLLVLAAYMAIAADEGAVGPVQAWPVLLQFLSIAGFTALGGIIGARAKSYLAAPAVMAVLVLLNTVFAQYGFRRFSQVGEGTSDFEELRYGYFFLTFKTVFFLGLLALALPLPRLSFAARVVRTGVAATSILVSGALLYTSNQPLLTVAEQGHRCAVAHGVQLCLPSSLERFRPTIAAAMTTAEQPLAREGLQATLPPRATVVPRVAVRLPKGSMALYLSPATVHDHRQLVLEVIRGLTAAEECDDLAGAAGPPDDVLIGRAALGGWLQQQVGVVDPTSYPSDVVAALQGLAPVQQASTLRTMFRQVWTCSPHVSLPPESTS